MNETPFVTHSEPEVPVVAHPEPAPVVPEPAPVVLEPLEHPTPGSTLFEPVGASFSGVVSTHSGFVTEPVTAPFMTAEPIPAPVVVPAPVLEGITVPATTSAREDLAQKIIDLHAKLADAKMTVVAVHQEIDDAIHELNNLPK